MTVLAPLGAVQAGGGLAEDIARPADQQRLGPGVRSPGAAGQPRAACPAGEAPAASLARGAPPAPAHDRLSGRSMRAPAYRARLIHRASACRAGVPGRPKRRTGPHDAPLTPHVHDRDRQLRVRAAQARSSRRVRSSSPRLTNRIASAPERRSASAIAVSGSSLPIVPVAVKPCSRAHASVASSRRCVSPSRRRDRTSRIHLRDEHRRDDVELGILAGRLADSLAALRRERRVRDDEYACCGRAPARRDRFVRGVAQLALAHRDVHDQQHEPDREQQPAGERADEIASAITATAAPSTPAASR